MQPFESKVLFESSQWQDSNAQFTVFIGIKGERWVSDVIKNLDSQIWRKNPVLIALNGPNNIASEKLVTWARTSDLKIRLVENSLNLGAFGNWEHHRLNVKTPWAVWMHADDVYLPTYLLTFAKLIPLHSGVGGIVLGLGQATADGAPSHRLPTPNGHLSLAPGHQVLLEILSGHLFPTPTLAVRLDALDGFKTQWHDSYGGDSELFFHLSTMGGVLVVQENFAFYRDNPISQARQALSHHNEFAWTGSVTNIIYSPVFETAMSQVPDKDRLNYAKQLMRNATSRFPTSPVNPYLRILILQRLVESWHYKVIPVNNLLREEYLRYGEGSLTNNLIELSGQTEPEIFKDVSNTTANSKKFNIRELISFMLNLLPLSMSERIWRFASRAKRLVRKNR